MSDDAVATSEEAVGADEATDTDEPTGADDEVGVGEQQKTPPQWLGTTAAAKRLGITTRTLYRFIDEGHVVAYRLGRVIRVKRQDVDGFIESCRIQPGSIGHLYPPVANRATSEDGSHTEEGLVGAGTPGDNS